MFRRDLYRAMARVLHAFDAATLARTSCYFGGGTRLALAHDEFRLSRDIDFLCSDQAGYADLRYAAREQGYRALFVAPEKAGLAFPREIRADRYGIRFPVVVEGVTIRVELVREARIALSSPESAAWSPVLLVSIADMFAEKLLANSDRGADRDELARDLIDLATLRLAHGPIPESAWRAVEGAYRAAPRGDLMNAATRFLADPAFQARCFRGLDIQDGGRVLAGVRALLSDLGGELPDEAEPQSR